MQKWQPAQTQQMLSEKILRVQNVNDYARYIGAPELHPLVSIIHDDEPSSFSSHPTTSATSFAN